MSSSKCREARDSVRDSDGVHERRDLKLEEEVQYWIDDVLQM